MESLKKLLVPFVTVVILVLAFLAFKKLRQPPEPQKEYLEILTKLQDTRDSISHYKTEVIKWKEQNDALKSELRNYNQLLNKLAADQQTYYYRQKARLNELKRQDEDLRKEETEILELIKKFNQ